jgi:release factor glutamine methyltransferase
MSNELLQWQVGLSNPSLEEPPLEKLRSLKLLPDQEEQPASNHRLDPDFFSAIARRRKGMPWEYILGRARFMGRTFHCSQDTLIPTEDTSGLVAAAAHLVRQKEQTEIDLCLIEVGTGCGNIAISLALESEHTKILASDFSSAAIEIARKNVELFQLQHRISLFCGDLFTPFQRSGFEQRADFIVCNPPYIPTRSLSKLPPEIVNFEPHLALDGGPFGIDFYLRLISEAPRMLKPGGTLLFEIGERQEKLVQNLFGKDAYNSIEPIFYGTKIRGFQATTS